MIGDGNGWVRDPDGSRYWGRFGAAGLLVTAGAVADGTAEDGPVVLLQHRAAWSHQGGTWSVPGGARDSHESASDAALREAGEEAGLDPAAVQIMSELVTARSVAGWTYTTVLARVEGRPALIPNAESLELAWVPLDTVDTLPLHPAFAAAWPRLRPMVAGAQPG
ncbi:NUDIX hydrolase [Tsukamurella soli]|uniref:NUDIX domain-containing protein n=1 Tax=Tsukamurella soli TaxID=644556 RepID=A0ABP8JCX1_9ACTN